MTVPAVNEFHRPIMEALRGAPDGLSYKNLIEDITAKLSLNGNDLLERTPSGRSRVNSHTYSAAYNLKLAGLVEQPATGTLKITSKGLQYLASHSGMIRQSELKQLWEEPGESSKEVETIFDSVGEVTPEEQIDQSYHQMMRQLTDEILDGLNGLSPSSFGRLLSRLFSQMGYGDGRVVGQSGDQGVDGILNQDTLGLEKIYVQAKRYTDIQVGEPAIRNFSGSLVAKGATKGVFITTSSFSSTAKDTAKDISKGNQFIRLIDGRELAELMNKHGVGVVTEITYEVKKLDANYFAEI